MATLFTNNFSTTLAASLASGATTLTVASTANLPAIPAGSFLPLTLTDAAGTGVIEIVYATARTGAVVTVTRGQESTTALTWAAGDKIYSSVTAAVFASFAPGNGSGSTAIDTSSTNQTKAGNFTAPQITAVTQFNGPGTGLTGIPNAALVTNPVVSVTATGNLSSSGGTTPAITLAAIPSFTTVNVSNDITAGGNVSVGNLSSGGNVTTGSSLFFTSGGQISGGGSTPMVANAGANLISLQGNNVTTGVDIAQANGSAGAICRFVLGSTPESYVDTGGVYVHISDRREKKNIVRQTDGIKRAMRLKPVEFDRKANGVHEMGFIAQDVKRIVPTAVKYDKKANRHFLADSQLISVLTAAFQEQQAMILAQQKQIDALLKQAAKKPRAAAARR